MEKENQNDPKKQNEKIIPQSTDEIETLNEGEELDGESLEKIAGAADGRIWGCNKKNSL